MILVCKRCLPKGFPSSGYYSHAMTGKCALCERERPASQVRVVEATDAADFRFQLWKRSYEKGASP